MCQLRGTDGGRQSQRVGLFSLSGMPFWPVRYGGGRGSGSPCTVCVHRCGARLAEHGERVLYRMCAVCFGMQCCTVCCTVWRTVCCTVFCTVYFAPPPSLYPSHPHPHASVYPLYMLILTPPPYSPPPPLPLTHLSLLSYILLRGEG